MFKTNLYSLFFLGFLFVNSSNACDFSASNTNNQSISTGEPSQIPIIYNSLESSNTVTSVFPLNSGVTPQSYNWRFNSSNNTFMSPVTLLGWNPNHSTNTLNTNNVSLPITHESKDFNYDFAYRNNKTSLLIPSESMSSNDTNISVVTHTQQQEVTNEVTYPIATEQLEQSSYSSTGIVPLFPISRSITPESHNRHFNSSSNTSIPSFILSDWEPNHSTNTFNLFFASHTQQQKVVHSNQDNQPVLSEKNKKKKCNKTYTCPTCNKTLANRSSFNYHIKTHDPNRERTFQCKLCDKSFYENNALKKHINRHNKGKVFECDFCSKHFKTKQEKRDHHRTHTGEKPCKCPLCSKLFSARSSLNYHVRIHHNKQKPYKCKICDKFFTTKSTLQSHIRTHTGEKPFKCDICGKGLSSKAVLKNHLNKHKNKKPHKCNQCTRAYATKDGLKYHLKTHNRAKTYTCEYCGASFARKNEYGDHIKYEEGTDEERKCHICKKGYSNKYNLERHNKKAHPER